MGTINTRLGGKHHARIGAGVDSGTAEDSAVHGNRKFSRSIANIGVIVRCSVATKSHSKLGISRACDAVVHARWQPSKGDIRFKRIGIVGVVRVTS